MPVGFYRMGGHVSSQSGENLLYVDDTGNIMEMEIAKPFVVTSFGNHIVVAGYDDHVYFIDEQQVSKEIEVGKGPFQLLVRE